MSLYGEYIKERVGKEIVESDKGFATYSYVDNGCYIEDIYVIPEHRRSGEAARLADEVAHTAKAKGLQKLFGSVVPSAKGSTSSLKVLLSYGFKLLSADKNIIYFEKDI